MLSISLSPRRWNTMVSSTRLRNSGRKVAFSSSMTCRRISSSRARFIAEAETLFFVGYGLGADVRGHDHNGVAEVHAPPSGVGQVPVVHDLEQYAPHVLMSLLDLVEQHDRPRLAPHLLSELAAVLVADVAGRGADQAADGVLLHIFRHVEPYHRVLVAVDGLRQRAAQLCLPTPVGPRNKGAHRTLRVLQADAAAVSRAPRPRRPRPARRCAFSAPLRDHAPAPTRPRRFP